MENSKSIINSSGKRLGVAHGDDVFLIFDNRDLSDYSEEEKLIGRNFVKMYENFAFNSPVIFGATEISNLDEDENLECLEIFSSLNNSMVAIEKSFGNSDFWNNLKINE